MNSKNQQGATQEGEVKIADKARDSAHEIVDKVACTVAEIEKNAREGSKLTEQKVSEMANSVQKKGQVYLGKTSNYVQQNPFKALGIAVASGYLISKLASNTK